MKLEGSPHTLGEDNGKLKKWKIHMITYEIVNHSKKIKEEINNFQ